MNRDEVLKWLKQHGTQRTRAGMARYGIHAEFAFGVTMGSLLSLAKRLEKNHTLAAELWESGWYEARLLAAMVEEPQLVTRRQMNAWAGDFDNWGVCDTVCWHLFERIPLAWEKARQWSESPREFVKRAAFAIMAGLALHDKSAADARFLAFLPLIEKAAPDERNFVKKGVNWALRAIGDRNLALNAAAREVAKRLARSESAACRWIGKDAERKLASPQVRARLARREFARTVAQSKTRKAKS